MAELVVVPANVKSEGQPDGSGVAGGTITAGDVIYPNAGNEGKYERAIATAAAPGAVIALNDAAVDQPVSWANLTILTFGTGALTSAGRVLAISNTNAGKLTDYSDIPSAARLIIMGWSIDADRFNPAKFETGLPLP